MKLKPCPHCKGTDFDIGSIRYPPKSPRRWFVVCNGCQYCGITAWTRLGAVLKWIFEKLEA